MFDAYILCASARSGTTLLCNLLKDTGVAGAPDSFYRTEDIEEWSQNFDIPTPDKENASARDQAFLKGVIKWGRGSTAVFGMRLMQMNLDSFRRRLAGIYPELHTDKARIQKAIGRTLFVHVSRADKTAQAVSWIKANQTGLWHMNADGSEYERTHAPAEPIYDFDQLHAAVKDYEAYDKAWETWFAAQGIEPHRITYEQLAEDPNAVLADLLHVLGQDPGLAQAIPPRVSKLADQTSREWIARYHNARNAMKAGKSLATGPEV